jgi:hypothetical protein
MSGRLRWRLLLVAIALTLIAATTGGPGSADASAATPSYDVVECGLGSNPAPDAVNYEQGSGHFSESNSCSSGSHLQVIGDGSGSTIWDTATANWHFKAPEGAGFSAISVLATLREHDNQIARLIVDNENGADYAAFGTGCSTCAQQTYSWSKGTGPDRTKLRGSLTCQQNGGCANPSSGRAFLQMEALRFTLEDSEIPNVSLAGSLLDGAPKSGNQNLTLEADDHGGGVHTTEVKVNGTLVTSKTESCALLNSTTATQLSPCPLSVSEPHTYNTAQAPFVQGQNTITVCAEDFDKAGSPNSNCSPYDVTIDNHPPDTTIESGLSGATGYNDASFDFSSDEWGSSFECRLDGAAWAGCASPKSYAQLANGAHSFSVRATDRAGNLDSSPPSQSWTVNTNAVTGPTDTKILAGPYGTSNSRSASFSFSSNKLGATFKCQLDGSAFATCKSPVSYAGLADGAHTFEVRAADVLGTVDQTPAARTWTVDLGPAIYHAKEYDGDPASGGQLLNEDWGRIGTQTGRHEDSDTIATRETVDCESPNVGKCDETRVITPLDTADPRTDPQAPVAYDVTLGSSQSDPELAPIVDILQPATISDAPTSTGPIANAAASWQTLPSGHGPSYALYTKDDTDENGPYETKLWVDESTKMPLKQVITSPGQPDDNSYWTYDAAPTQASDLPTGFLDLPRPANVLQETDVNRFGGANPGPVTDRETGANFTPYDLGLTLSIPGSSFCLSSLDVVHFNSWDTTPITVPDPELPPPDPPDPFETMVDAVYNPADPGATCTPGKVEAANPPLEVLSYASDSTSGQIWTDAYKQPALAIAQDPSNPDFQSAGPVSVTVNGPTVAYVLPINELGSAAQLTLGNSTVIVQGKFDKTDLPLIANSLVPR